jgi:radical SAM/Cys-rich protein
VSLAEEIAERNAELAAALASFPPFVERVAPEYRESLEQLDVLQVNITRQCNIVCKHCHLDCGPSRTEHMSRKHLQQCLDVFELRGFKTLDITGGAPEMNPDFEWFIREAGARGIPMIVRSNLVIHEQAGYEHLPELFAELGVNVVASLPHYRERNMEKQRGAGTFTPVIRGLKRLNELGYGRGEQGRNAKGQLLQLDLVFNPAGIAMPPDQASMEAEYKRRLLDDYGIVFDNLFTFTNAPGGRFGAALLRAGKLDAYMGKLIAAFNPDAVPNMMCRTELSVAPDGSLYDCDFNQATGMPCADGRTIGDLLDVREPLGRRIVFGNHCYSCTAGAGSS